MEQYDDLSGKSGVTSFEIGEGCIRVEFRNGPVYLYNNAITGNSNIQKMISLAKSGKGLNTFINQNVKDKYVK